MEYKDYYRILGVPRTASKAEIRKAFRKLAREHHPDVKPGDEAAERRFKDVNEANAVLSDPDKRKQYDTLGANWGAFSRAGAQTGGDPFASGGPFAGFGGFRSAPGGPNVRYEFRTSGGNGGAGTGGFSDFFERFFGGGPSRDDAGGRGSRPGDSQAGGKSFADILEQMGIDGSPAGDSFGGARSREPVRVAPLEARAELTLEEAFEGTTRIVDLGGKRLQVTIPRGVSDGNRIRLSGKGPAGQDVEVVTNVRPHAVFRRRAGSRSDLERDLPIRLEEALLGADVPVSTLRGRLLLKIPPGTQNGRSFRLKGKGMPRLGGEDAGDLYVRVRVVLPSELSPEASAAARQFLDLVEQPDPRTK